MTQTQTVTPTKGERTHNEFTYFLTIDDPHELKIAEAYVRQKYPNTLGKITKELRLLRLNDKATVIGLIRGDDRSPIERRALDERGQAVIIKVPYADLAHQVRECKPVKTADYWISQSDEYDAFGGELDRGRFIDALSIACTPIRAGTHIGTPNLLKLSFI